MVSFIPIVFLTPFVKDFIGLIPTFSILFVFFMWIRFDYWFSFLRTVFPGRGYLLPSEVGINLPDIDGDCDVRVDSGPELGIPALIANINISLGYDNNMSVDSIHYNPFSNCVSVPVGALDSDDEKIYHNVMNVSEKVKNRRNIIIRRVLPPIISSIGLSMVFITDNYVVSLVGVIVVVLGIIGEKYLSRLI